MDVAGVAGLRDQARPHALAAADEVVVHRRHRQQHRDRRPLLVGEAVADHQHRVPLVDGQYRRRAELVERLAQPRGAIGNGEAGVQRREVEIVHRRVPERGHLLVHHQRAGEVHEPRRLRRGLEHGVAPSDVGVERHHDLFADGVDGRVRDLREALPEIRVEQSRLVLQHGQRRVVAHGARRLLAVPGHWLDHVLQLLVRVAVELVEPVDALLRLLADVPVGAVELGVQVVEVALHPFAVRASGGDLALDVVVVEDAALGGVNRDHLAGAEAARFHDLAGRQIDEADLGAHHHQPTGGDLVASGAQAVAVHHRCGDGAVGEGDRGGAVPGLREAGVVLVERPQLGLHVRHVLPCLGDQHHHGVEQVAAGVDQQLQRLIERGGV